MGFFEYTFVTLTPSQLEQRRRQLDLAGFQAWLTPIILLATIHIYRRFLGRERKDSTTENKHFRDQRQQDSSSADTRHHQYNSKQPNPPPKLLLLRRRLHWTLNTTYIHEFGSLQIQILGLLYFSWLLYLVFRSTGTDYMHLTKSFGHIAVSQLPLHYLLAVKSPNSPITLATGLTHERLNAYHRIFGRMLHFLLAVHAVLYLRFFVKLGILAKRIADSDVRFGLIAFWTVNVLGLLALPGVRKRFYYALFYRSHVVLSLLLLVVLWFHVPYTRVYVGQAGVFWILGGIVRRCGSETVEARCEVLQGVEAAQSELVGVRFTVGKWSPLANATPGQHVYIRRGGLLGPKNPFTIANVRSMLNEDDGRDRHPKALMGPVVEVELVVRNTGGPQTSWLAKAVTGGSGNADDSKHKSRSQSSPGDTKSSTTKSRQSSVQLQVEGPYGESGIYLPRLLDEETHQPSSHGPTFLVAGGVGATYTIPIYLALLALRRTLGRSGRGEGGGGGGGKIKMIWLVKSLAAARWGIDIVEQAHQAHQAHQQQQQQQVGEKDVDIYVTRGSGNKEEDEDEDEDEQAEIDKATSTARLRTNHVNVYRLGHRPDLKSIVNAALAASGTGRSNNHSSSHSDSEGIVLDSRTATKASGEIAQRRDQEAWDPVTMYLCGPSSLARDVRSALTKSIAEGRQVDVYEEVFGFGGS